MLREAFGFPRNREGATRDLLIGGALVLASPLLFPVAILWGYLLRVMNAGARKRDVPPAFGDWGRLFADGLKAILVIVVWAVIPVFLALGGTAAAVFVFVLPLPPGVGLDRPALWAASTQELALVGVVAAALGLLVVVTLLHLPAALVALGTQGRLKAAFQTDALWAIVGTKQYLVGVLLAALVSGVGTLVATLLTPVLVGFVLLFYVQVTVAYVLGRTVGGAAITAIRPRREV